MSRRPIVLAHFRATIDRVDAKPGRNFWQIHLSTGLLTMCVGSAWIGLFIPARISLHWDDYLYLGIATVIVLFPVVCLFEWVVRRHEARTRSDPSYSVLKLSLTIGILCLILGFNLARIYYSSHYAMPTSSPFFELPSELAPEKKHPTATASPKPLPSAVVDMLINAAVIAILLGGSELLARRRAFRKP